MSNTQATTTQEPKLHIVTEVTGWCERLHDIYLPLQEAITLAEKLADSSKAQTNELGDFRFAFYDSEMYLESRGDRHAVRYRLNHWSFGQACTLVHAPAEFLRSLPGELATDCLNYKLQKRDRSVSVYRMIQDVAGISKDTVRSFTSTRYARLHDQHLLEWVRDAGYETSQVAISDRGVSVAMLGQHVNAPEGLPVRLALILENSEVGASSVKTIAVIQRAGLRIPITLAGARVRHVGADIKLKAVTKMEEARQKFEEVSRTELQMNLLEANRTEDMDRGEWYAFLKRRGIGKSIADKILPVGDEPKTSRWRLAIKLAYRASKIPYFDTRLQAELLASKVLGV